jgi:dTDP-4-amino-4,6-dideoxygalactose transaminase
MPIFNSLGSNYKLREVLIASSLCFSPHQETQYKTLLKKLEKYFQGKAVLLYNGRDAIEYCLTAYNISSNDQVLTQAFSCSSIEEAIHRVGAEVCYFDLAPGKIHTTLKQVKKAYDRAKQPKAVILQHTLGYQDEVEEISQFCQENNLLLIADLAQAVGAIGSNNQPLGLEADAVILSFGRDKVVDAITGGAVVFKTHPKKLPQLKKNRSSRKNNLSFKKTLYPFFTWLIRKTYSIGLGKVLHWIFKKLNIIQTSIKSPHHNYQPLPFNLPILLLDAWNQLDLQLDHRRQIAYYYFNQIKSNQKIALTIEADEIKIGTNLRFPALVQSGKQLQSLLNFLAKHQVYLYDRWYKKAVDSGSLKFESDYQSGSCPEAEKTAQTIINLPTHQNISIAEAEKVVKLINKWSQT